MSIENLPGELWLSIPGYETLYEVSNMGRVRSLPRECWNGVSHWLQPGRILRTGDNGHGYRYISLNSGKKHTKNHYVHRLVGTAFLPAPENRDAVEINHKDGDKTNNTAANLEWMTRKENALHGFATGLNRGRRGTEHWKSIPVEVVRWDGASLGIFANSRCASRSLGIPRTSIRLPYGTTRKVRVGVHYLREAFPRGAAQ